MSSPTRLRLKNNDYTIIFIIVSFLALAFLDAYRLSDSNIRTRRVLLPVVVIGYDIVRLWGTCYLLYKGSFIKSKWWKGMYVALPILFIGIIFKILFWPYGITLTIIGMSICCLLYSFHFFQKEQKKLYDICVYTSILSTVVISGSDFLHIAHISFGEHILFGLYLFTLVAFFLSRIEKIPPSQNY
jgi:hypothetical protein